ncbi:hypothetical protein LY76DRAFT_403533 [Colletotrichum caudatum]|nr:hypothetical protein LY76DRAFT_403533 [Colletotrichum caudatum]
MGIAVPSSLRTGSARSSCFMAGKSPSGPTKLLPSALLTCTCPASRLHVSSRGLTKSMRMQERCRWNSNSHRNHRVCLTPNVTHSLIGTFFILFYYLNYLSYLGRRWSSCSEASPDSFPIVVRTVSDRACSLSSTNDQGLGF